MSCTTIRRSHRERHATQPADSTWTSAASAIEPTAPASTRPTLGARSQTETPSTPSSAVHSKTLRESPGRPSTLQAAAGCSSPGRNFVAGARSAPRRAHSPLRRHRTLPNRCCGRDPAFPAPRSYRRCGRSVRGRFDPARPGHARPGDELRGLRTGTLFTEVAPCLVTMPRREQERHRTWSRRPDPCRRTQVNPRRSQRERLGPTAT
jgi:hypothetical protein